MGGFSPRMFTGRSMLRPYETILMYESWYDGADGGKNYDWAAAMWQWERR